MLGAFPVKQNLLQRPLLKQLFESLIALWPEPVEFQGQKKTLAEWWALYGPAICAAILKSEDIAKILGREECLWEFYPINVENLPAGTLDLLPKRSV